MNFFIKFRHIMLVPSILGLTVLFSCSGDGESGPTERDQEQINAVMKGMLETSQKKDSTINAFVSTINEIQNNLDEIKDREGIIELTTQNPELNQSQQDKVIADVKLINELMIENREAIENLNRRLNTANEDLKDSNIKLDEMAKLVERLTKQIEQKDGEILSLRGELADMNFQLENLESAYQSQSTLVEQMDKEINTGFYAFGSKKELMDEGVITKEGGFIGLGKIEKLKDDFNKNYFTKIDVLETREIPILSKKVKVVTSHPKGSYELIGEDKVEKILIKSPQEFWKASKYLVIVLE